MDKAVKMLIKELVSDIPNKAKNCGSYSLAAKKVIDGIQELKNNWPSIANSLNDEEARELDAVCKTLEKVYGKY